MIFFGLSKERSTDTQAIPLCSCPNCRTQNDMYVTTLIRYAHVYWIPFFPAGKRTVAFCNHCKANYDYKSLNEQHAVDFCREFESAQSFPLSYWAIFLIALAGGVFMFLRYLFTKILSYF